jgi:hypothetical protein
MAYEIKNNGDWHARWWTQDKHGSAWERIKESMRRDWEQTKNDFKAGGKDLNQDVGDTVKQAAGKQEIPPPNEPNWEDVEQAYSYGYGAHQEFGNRYAKWNDDLERDLRTEWEAGHDKDKYKWDAFRPYVQRGWEQLK